MVEHIWFHFANIVLFMQMTKFQPLKTCYLCYSDR